jgi:hypothetical protein
MARTIETIFQGIRTQAISLATAANNQELVDMYNNTSRVALWRLMFYALAFGIYVLETLFDNHRKDIDERIDQLAPHKRRWYAEKAKGFQYGCPLIPETDEYDNTALTDTQVQAAKIISHAAVVEQARGVRIKVAKTVGGDLGPLVLAELDAFKAYMEEIKAAGVPLNITSSPADDLKASLRIYYDPLVLNGQGARIDGTEPQPVQTALREYLKNLPFNGLFIPQYLVDQLQQVEGVRIVKEDGWQARYGALRFESIDVEYLPDSGYLRIADADLTIQFLPHASI